MYAGHLAQERLREERALQRLADIEASVRRRSERRVDRAMALLSLADVQGGLGKLDEAVENSARSLALVRSGPPESPYELPHVLLAAAQWLRHRGDLADAQSLVKEALATVETSDDPAVRSSFEEDALGSLAAVYLDSGDLERAEEAARRRMDYADERRIRHEEGGQDRAYHGDVVARVQLGQIRSERGDRQGALRFIDDALQVIDRFYGPAKQEADLREFNELRRRHNPNAEDEVHSFFNVLAEERAEIEQLRHSL